MEHIESASRYKQFQRVPFTDEHNRILQGSILLHDGTILRFDTEGLLHCETEPAVDCNDGHAEEWTHGMLTSVHRTDGKTEQWENGSIISVIGDTR